MPVMSGMELVLEVNARFPHVPIVIVTAKGSEEAASEALMSGASGYVPKDRIEMELAPTVRRLLSISHSHKSHLRLLARMRGSDHRFVLDNDPTYLTTLNNFLRDAVAQMGICNESERTQMSVALDEALVNALFHGNLEISSELHGEDNKFYELAQQRRHESPYKERQIDVRASLTQEEAKFMIRDEGPGFDLATLPDPTDSSNLDRLSGRGVMLMYMFMDEVDYNDAGNEVTLIKRRSEETE